MAGYITVVHGPMFSGKTSTGIIKLTECIESVVAVAKTLGLNKDQIKSRYQGCYINHSKDVRRLDTDFSSHNPIFNNVYEFITTKKAERLAEMNDFVKDIKFIMVDEGQFFTDLVKYVSLWKSWGKHVIVCGLDMDYLNKGFNQMPEIMNMANIKIKTTAYCFKCIESSISTDEDSNSINNNLQLVQAEYTHRISKDSEKEVVGGTDKYISVCLYHYTILNYPKD